jgi:hypothetical protein
VTILIRLMLNIGSLPLSSLPLSPFLTPLKAIARGFFVLFHVDI